MLPLHRGNAIPDGGRGKRNQVAAQPAQRRGYCHADMTRDQGRAAFGGQFVDDQRDLSGLAHFDQRRNRALHPAPGAIDAAQVRMTVQKIQRRLVGQLPSFQIDQGIQHGKLRRIFAEIAAKPRFAQFMPMPTIPSDKDGNLAGLMTGHCNHMRCDPADFHIVQA